MVPTVKSVNYDLKSIRFLGPKIWENFPNNLKSIESFKMTFKEWKLESCPCRLCKTYLQNICKNLTLISISDMVLLLAM